MTAATLPDIDLEQWLSHEAEKACQAEIPPANDPCPNVADWIIRPRCDAGCPVRAGFICSECKSSHDTGQLLCRYCNLPLHVTWTERLR